MSLPTCGSGYIAALHTFVPWRCRRQNNSPMIVATSIMPPRTATKIAAVDTESPPDCVCSGMAVVVILVEALAKPGVEVIETGAEGVFESGADDDTIVVKEASKCGVGINEPVSTDVALDILGRGADRSQKLELKLPILLTFTRCPILIGWTSYARIACFNHTASYETLNAVVENAPVRAASIMFQFVRVHYNR